MKTLAVIRCAVLFLLACPLALSQQERPPAPAECRPVEAVLLERDTAQVTCEVSLDPAEVAEVVLPSIALPETVSVVDFGKPVETVGVERDVMVARTAATAQNNAKPPEEEAPTPRKRNVLRWRAAKKEKRDATVSFLAKGLGWQPQYRLAAGRDGKVRLSLSAAVTNGDLAMPGVRLTFRYAPSEAPPPDASAKGTRRELAWLASRYGKERGRRVEVAPSYEIALGGPHDVAPNGVTVIALWPEVQLPAEAFACWATSIAAPPAAVWHIENVRKEPLPRGRADVYVEEALLGSDEVAFTPPGGHACLSVADAGEVSCEKRLEVIEPKPLDEAHRDYKWHHVFRLSVRNLSKGRALVLVLDPTYEDPLALSRRPEPDLDDGRWQVWRMEVEGGQERTIAQEFYSYHEYAK